MSLGVEQLESPQLVGGLQLFFELGQLDVPGQVALLSYQVGDVLEEVHPLRHLAEVPYHVERVDEVGSFECAALLEPVEGGEHAGLLVRDEGLGLAAAVDEGLEDLAEGIGCLFAGDRDAEGDDLVVAVDSREDPYCVLPSILRDVSDDVVGEVVADGLTELPKVFFHLRTDYY